MRLPLLIPAAVVLLAGCTADKRAEPAQPAPTRTACGSTVETGPLPEWARAGFSDDSSMPHVMGDRGSIVAAIFGFPLTAARSDGTANKILWVSKPASADPEAAGELVIDARLDGSDVSARRSVPGGPGPSIIDLPQSGCWRLTLTWWGRTDTMDLTYR